MVNCSFSLSQMSGTFPPRWREQRENLKQLFWRDCLWFIGFIKKGVGGLCNIFTHCSHTAYKSNFCIIIPFNNSALSFLVCLLEIISWEMLMQMYVYSQFQLRFRQLKSWLPRNPMKLDKEALPDLEETDCYTAPFSRARMHQYVLHPWPCYNQIPCLLRKTHIFYVYWGKKVIAWHLLHYGNMILKVNSHGLIYISAMVC